MNSSSNDEYQEIDLVQLIFAVFRNWRAMIGLGLIIGLFAVFTKIAVYFIFPYNSEELNTQMQVYQNLVNNSEQAMVNSRDKQNQLQVDIANLTDYINESVYMKIDPYNEYIAERLYFVKTDYQIMPSMTYQNIDRTDSIVKSYVSLTMNQDFLKEYSDSNGIELKYLQELVSVTNEGAGVLKFTVVGTSATFVQNIMEYLASSIDSNKSVIEEAMEHFDISELSRCSYVKEEASLGSYQIYQRDRLVELMKAYSDELDNFKKLSSTVFEVPSGTVDSLVKDCIKLFIIGIVIGVVMVCVYAAVIFIVGSKLYSARSLEDRYNLYVIAKYAKNNGKKATKFDNWIRTKEGRSIPSSYVEDVAYDLAVSYINNELTDGMKLMIVGQTTVESVSRVADRLSAKLKNIIVIDGKNLISDANAVATLPTCDAIVLVEESSVSLNLGIKKELDLIRRYDRKLLGALVIED